MFPLSYEETLNYTNPNNEDQHLYHHEEADALISLIDSLRLKLKQELNFTTTNYEEQVDSATNSISHHEKEIERLQAQLSSEEQQLLSANTYLEEIQKSELNQLRQKLQKELELLYKIREAILGSKGILGDSCNNTNNSENNDCHQGFKCDDDHLCKVDTGYACNQNQDCVQGICFDSSCRLKSGSSCESHHECVNRVCSFDSFQCMENLESCQQILNHNPNVSSGIYMLRSSKTNQEYRAYCDFDTNQGGWTLALNLDTSDGHVMWWANDLWITDDTYRFILDENTSSAFESDHKSISWIELTGNHEIMIMIHKQGTPVGWRSFSIDPQYRDQSMREIMSSGNADIQFGSHVTNAYIDKIWSQESLVRASSSLYFNFKQGKRDVNRISSHEAHWDNNRGGGLGNWEDAKFCGKWYGSTLGGYSCSKEGGFRTTSEAQAGWGSCYEGGGQGYFGTDSFVPGTNKCEDTNEEAGWAQENGIEYDYAIFIR